MELTRRIALAATSYADDLSFRSLAEVSDITADDRWCASLRGVPVRASQTASRTDRGHCR